MSDAAGSLQPVVDNRASQGHIPPWLRVLSRLPLPLWYGVADGLAFLAEYVLRYRRKVVDMQLRKCFPDIDDAALSQLRHGFYRNFADVVVESVKAISITPEELRGRFEVHGAELVRDHVRSGRFVVFTTSHNCNWEWSLLILSLELGVPLHAAYKPLHQGWSDRLFLGIRGRFGAQMVPAKRLLRHVLRRRKQPCVVAMVADQDPVSAAARHFTQFFGQETAFYQGPEALARAIKAPIVFVAPRRVGRGRYRIDLELLVDADEQLPEGEMTERFVQRVEALIRERPADWLWSYRRWKIYRNQDGVVMRRRGRDAV